MRFLKTHKNRIITLFLQLLGMFTWTQLQAQTVVPITGGDPGDGFSPLVTDVAGVDFASQNPNQTIQGVTFIAAVPTSEGGDDFGAYNGYTAPTFTPDDANNTDMSAILSGFYYSNTSSQESIIGENQYGQYQFTGLQVGQTYQVDVFTIADANPRYTLIQVVGGTTLSDDVETLTTPQDIVYDVTPDDSGNITLEWAWGTGTVTGSSGNSGLVSAIALTTGNKRQAPVLAAQMVADSQIQLSWLVTPVSYELQSSSNVTGPFAYAGLLVSTQNAASVALDTMNGAAKFYRLQEANNLQLIPVVSEQSDPDGATLQMNPGIMKLQVFSPSVVRVAYSTSNAVPPWNNSFSVTASPLTNNWPLTTTPTDVRLDTGLLEVRINRASGAVGFYDTNGIPILLEPITGGKSLTSTMAGGVVTLASQQQFAISPTEAFYGLGQHQSGVMDYAYSTVHLQQMNPGESAVPMLVSSHGYGMLWDNPSITDVNFGIDGLQVIPSTQLFTTNEVVGGLNGSYYSGTNFNTFLFSRVDPQINFNWDNSPPTNTMALMNYSVEWDGFIKAEQTGTYIISVSSDDGARLWIDGVQLLNDWTSRSSVTYNFRLTFAQNSVHSIRLQYYQNTGDATVQLAWITPVSNPLLTWASQAANSINYYFMYGPSPDNVIANYRYLTGEAPMFGKWAWGYWQSKNAYNSQAELLSVENQYRTSNIPIDCIVQDWYYWSPNPWGSDIFNAGNYPNVTQLMQTLHNNNVHMIISKWARFDIGTYTNYVQLSNADALYPEQISGTPNAQYYDAFNPTGRQLYWQQISNDLFSLDIDGWWLDASEPELNTDWGEYANYMTAAGSGAAVYNAYPLMHTTAVYQGQRSASSSKRVFILTRSAYAGQQRNAAVTWSGDIASTWPVFALQIPAGLNFSLSGIPYWNTDIGGYQDNNGTPTDPAYAELFTRWFQYGAFCPMFRVHGQGFGKEMWQFPTNTESILINFDQLRYHLLPYIYSVAWMVTTNAYTMMRPLVMDFGQDTNVYDIPDQYMFGPAVLVNPVTQAGATNRSVYLPTGTTWYDFWTGLTYSGGQTNDAAAPIGEMPLYIRAGSIIPYGPLIQYASQSVDPIELRVYRGADGAFTLYEDEDDNYNYETGAYATIPISWNDSAQTLTIGQRQGNFPGMLQSRTFNIVWVSSGHGVGVPSTTNIDVTVKYNGSATNIFMGN
jgi:alpha-D-xyloside xylohydrolase